MFWMRKPITHATLLWILVGVAVAAATALLIQASVPPDLREGLVESPLSTIFTEAQLPSTLFGTVVSFDGTIIKLDSKQPYDEVIIESDTTISNVGGSPAATSNLKTGVVLTATGKDLGDRRMSAIAVVILENR